MLDLIAVLAAGPRRGSGDRAPRRRTLLYRGAPDQPWAGRRRQVAAAIGISERQLSRVFAADGTSIPRHILSRRLHLAYSILSSAAAAGRPEPSPTSLPGAASPR